MGNMKRKCQQNMNIPMVLACVLFCLTLISIHITSGLYAKYSVNATGDDSARVITFGELAIVEEGDFDDDGAIYIPGVNLRKEATVHFDGSEAATYVFVEFALSSHWEAKTSEGTPNGTFVVKSGENELMSWSVAPGWTYLTTVDQTDAKTYVYYRALQPNQKLGTAEDDGSALIANDGAITVSDQMTKDQIAGFTDVGDMFVNLRGTVVQANGFDDAMAAWTSIAEKGGV